jgi:hypothetical protein
MFGDGALTGSRLRNRHREASDLDAFETAVHGCVRKEKAGILVDEQFAPRSSATRPGIHNVSGGEERAG